MFERPKAGERAVLVHIDIAGNTGDENLDEFHELVVSAGAEPVAIVTGVRRKFDAKYYVGTGKVAEIAEVVVAEAADVVLFNHALAPSQERNLEAMLKCRVLDRTGLILDIFAQRAHSHEGRLQVELAQLKHLSTRLVRGWTHLERQKGGIGLRGPGETQLETDRRLLNERIKQLNKRLDKVQRRRKQSRKARQRAELPTISLVGYTNAGKSTLFNNLTNSGVYAADQLFATLDPTFRRLELPQTGAAVLADTVGFIRHLPHDLIAAFQSTLEESRNSDLLLHVIDAHSSERHTMIEQVNEVLKEIDASTVPQIEVFNKIDLLDGEPPRIDRDEHGNVRRVWVSAQADMGMELLLEAIAEQFRDQRVHHWLDLPPDAGRLRARLFELEAVRSEKFGEQGEWHLEIEMDEREFEQLKRQKLLDEKMILTGCRAEN